MSRYVEKELPETDWRGPIKQIVIAESGWVFMGITSVEEEYVQIEDCSVIRKWGTTRGLGEIAFNGPTKTTELDPCGTVRLFREKVVAMMECHK